MGLPIWDGIDGVIWIYFFVRHLNPKCHGSSGWSDGHWYGVGWFFYSVQHGMYYIEYNKSMDYDGEGPKQ